MNTADMLPNDTHHPGDLDTVDIDKSLTDLLDSVPLRDPIRFVDREQDVISLYDQLSDLRLECALLKAQENHSKPRVHRPLSSVHAKVGLANHLELSNETAELQLRDAERECLEARSAYLLQNSIIEDIMLTAPILQAIHGSTDSNSLDRLSTTTDRDVTSMVHTNLSTMYQSIMNTLTVTETERTVTCRINQELTRNLFDMTDQLKAQALGESSDPELRQSLVKLQDDTKEAKRRWRIMKSLVSAVVAGSGVDWARNEHLRDLVIDNED
ncbi:hypothetical protein MMC11_006337 [Xylographa trunciseda]|nr:hypothetical protein [Xylographa trunciseda]